MPVAEAAGPRMQLTGIVGALAIALLLLVAPDLRRNLPTAAPAVAIGPFAVADFTRISCIHRGSSGCPFACFAGMAVLPFRGSAWRS